MAVEVGSVSDIDPGRYIRRLTGEPVGRMDGVPQCASCGAFLGRGASTTAYAFQHSDEQSLSVAHLYCPSCGDKTVTHSTLGAEEVVVGATLVTCHGRLRLSDVAVYDWSGAGSR